MAIWNPKAVALSKVAQDITAEPVDRLRAMYTVGMLADLGLLILADDGTPIPPTPVQIEQAKVDKPEYVWKNGARIRKR
jgi:hypothetical protein